MIHARNNETGTMQVGHTFTIETLICEGVEKHILWRDGWTATTKDGKRSAQFEHTLLVTPDGIEALTARTENSTPFAVGASPPSSHRMRRTCAFGCTLSDGCA